MSIFSKNLLIPYLCQIKTYKNILKQYSNIDNFENYLWNILKSNFELFESIFYEIFEKKQNLIFKNGIFNKNAITTIVNKINSIKNLELRNAIFSFVDDFYENNFAEYVPKINTSTIMNIVETGMSGAKRGYGFDSLMRFLEERFHSVNFPMMPKLTSIVNNYFNDIKKNVIEYKNTNIIKRNMV